SAGTFTTSDRVDEAAPEWEGLKSGEVSAGLFEGCGAGEPFVVLGLGKRSDDQTPPAALRYAVWVGQAGKPLDYDRAPSAVVTAWGDRLSLGPESRCAPADLQLAQGLAARVEGLDPPRAATAPSRADRN